MSQNPAVHSMLGKQQKQTLKKKQTQNAQSKNNHMLLDQQIQTRWSLDGGYYSWGGSAGNANIGVNIWVHDIAYTTWLFRIYAG